MLLTFTGCGIIRLMKCQHCDKEITNKGSCISHEMSCKQNPERVKHFRSPLAGAKKGSTGWSKGIQRGAHKRWVQLYPHDQVFVENSTYHRNGIKRRILAENLKPYICAICGQLPNWCNKPMPLILDHINGINNDNRLDNLRFVCGHCDSQLPTYKSKNRVRKVGRVA